MIGEIIFKLTAENSASLKFINGRLMHAAFFQILNFASPGLNTFVHEEMNLKPFTVSFLNPEKKLPTYEDQWKIRRGDKFFWRVTALNEEILRAILSVPVGYQMQVGNLFLSVKKISVEKIISMQDFILKSKNSAACKKLEFKFLSPVSFRTDNFDAPYPRADLIFSSLADKWTQAQMPAAADKKIIRELAKKIRLTEWEGRSKKFFFAKDRGTLAFWGKFLYDMGNFPDDVRKVFQLLAKFGEFSGVGRLTGQGFGQTQIKIF